MSELLDPLNPELFAEGAPIPSAPPSAERSWTNLPDEFWTARPMFQQIRQAAHARGRSADAVFGYLLARASAFIPPTITLPPIVGAPAPLSTYVAITGPPGVGKSSALAVAAELLPLPVDLLEVADRLPLGSGEGLVDAYFDTVDALAGQGKKPTKRQVRYGLFMSLDEGQTLSEVGNRKGSTILPTLRTAWTGGVVGSTNASAETRRRLEQGSYTLGVAIAFQPEKAADLLNDATGGTPQRFVWMAATDPSIPDHAPPWPGPLSWLVPPLEGRVDAQIAVPLRVADSVAAEIRAANLGRTRGESVVNELDAHADLARLKVSGLLAQLDNWRDEISEQDWMLAGMVMRASGSVRYSVQLTIEIAGRHRAEASDNRAARREATIDNDRVSRANGNLARAMAKHVQRHTCAVYAKHGHCTRRCLQQSGSSVDRKAGDLEAALEQALQARWIIRTDDTFSVGTSAPT